MKWLARYSGITVFVLALLLLSVQVQARDLDQDEALRLRQSGTILGLEQVMQGVLERYPEAKLLEAELEEKHGQYRYDIELLTLEGVARELDVDARDGRILRDKEDD
jgi:uncharacterized membrane protein YkoI